MNLSNQERQLSDENIAAIQYCKVELGLSNEQIHRVSGHSLASISKYTSGLVSKVREQTPDPPSTNGNERIEASTSAKEATNGSEYQPPESRNGEDVLPRKSYQITAPRPVIVEGGNGKESGDRQYEESRVVVRGPYMSNTVPDTLERIFSYSALTAGYTNVGDYVAEQILPDIKTLSIIKAAIPHTDRDSLEHNFLATVEDANSFRRLTRLSREEARKEMEKNNGNTS